MPKTDPRPFQVWRREADAKTAVGQRLTFHSCHREADARDKNLERVRALGDGWEYVARDPDDRDRPDGRQTF